MREQRSASQILFGFLPEQTVDLRGRIWKVSKWSNPIRERIDHSTLRRELIRQALPWAFEGNDAGYVERLHKNADIEVLSLSTDNGVSVIPFPEVWICRKCSRVTNSDQRTCNCGVRQWGQMHFVGYHSCGALVEPWIRKCKTHNDVAVRFPGTSSAGEILFYCPTCKAQVQKGFFGTKCACGEGQVQYNVHRAASVFTPRGVVVVNPPSPEKMQEMALAGGSAKAVAWVVDGMTTRWMNEGAQTRAAFVENLIKQNIKPDLAEKFADDAVAAGDIADDVDGALDEFETEVREEAEAGAATIAMATATSRIQIAEMAGHVDAWTTLGQLYHTSYPAAIERAGLSAVELIDRFPVLTGQFGYTRGDPSHGKSKLVPFRSQKNAYVVYADISQTEALFLRLDPLRVVSWLAQRGFEEFSVTTDPRAARLAVLEHCRIPGPGSELVDTPGAALLELVHSFAHRFIRRVAVFAGIERTALSELLVPSHLGFFVYAASRGDFVLGGLQAIFESELDQVLNDFVRSEHRCALDPGCAAAGAACMACLHLGEPSCRHYNSHLDRRTLFGELGYLTT